MFSNQINNISASSILSEEVKALQKQLAAAQAKIAELEEENKELKSQVAELSINKNFNTLTRVANFTKTVNVIKEERRKEEPNQLYLVTLDIGGMGDSNSNRGELSTNIAMTKLLEEARSMIREKDIMLLVDGQVNSGDEFAKLISVSIHINEEYLDVVIERLDQLAYKHGFQGVYASYIKVEGTPNKEELEELINKGMEKIYPIKKKKKAERAALAAEIQSALGGLGIVF